MVIEDCEDAFENGMVCYSDADIKTKKEVYQGIYEDVEL